MEERLKATSSGSPSSFSTHKSSRFGPAALQSVLRSLQKTTHHRANWFDVARHNASADF